jgi:fatty acid desaturase
VGGLFIVVGGWLIGPGKRATALRRVSTPALREHAMAVRVGLAFLILLLVIWGPVPWTRSLWPVLVFAIVAFVWLERVRHRTLEEFGDVPAGELGRSVRERWGRRPGGTAQPGAG